jgi:hypothetical protein
LRSYKCTLHEFGFYSYVYLLLLQRNRFRSPVTDRTFCHAVSILSDLMIELYETGHHILEPGLMKGEDE